MKNMKKIGIGVIVALMAWGWTGCNAPKENNGLCKVQGTVNPRFNGKKIFLVPIEGPATMETVDSVVIADGKFEFESECGEMKVIRIDYRHRMGVEDLLVVMEPGELVVNIDTISSGKGTPQNDSLQGWKEYTMKHFQRLTPYRQQAKMAKENGDMSMVEQLQVKVDSLERAYRKHSRELAARMGEGPLQKFLSGRFPTSYKKKMPDGTITTVYVD